MNKRRVKKMIEKVIKRNGCIKINIMLAGQKDEITGNNVTYHKQGVAIDGSCYIPYWTITNVG